MRANGRFDISAGRRRVAQGISYQFPRPSRRQTSHLNYGTCGLLDHESRINIHGDATEINSGAGEHEIDGAEHDTGGNLHGITALNIRPCESRECRLVAIQGLKQEAHYPPFRTLSNVGFRGNLWARTRQRSTPSVTASLISHPRLVGMGHRGSTRNPMANASLSKCSMSYGTPRYYTVLAQCQCVVSPTASVQCASQCRLHGGEVQTHGRFWGIDEDGVRYSR